MGFKVFEAENKLIHVLKEQHQDIVGLIKNLKPFIEGKRFAKANCVTTLINLRRSLIEHLALEDKYLYPNLAQSKLKKTRQTGKKFSKEMIKISKIAVDFLNKYSNLKIFELESNKEFKKELKDLGKVVLERIEIEEDVLFLLYITNPLSTEFEKKKYADYP